jgi:hypothetical protein
VRGDTAKGRPEGPVSPDRPLPLLVPRKPQRSMDDLVLPAAVRHRIDLALSQVDNHEILYQHWNLKKIDPYRVGTALNFYGPSGTGKSLAAEAIAHQRRQLFIDVSYAEIESKYVGDTPKNIEACFRQAAARDAVLVFNEADSILGSRLSNVTQSSDHSVNVSRAVMLSQLDAFGGLVVFTTNSSAASWCTSGSTCPTRQPGVPCGRCSSRRRFPAPSGWTWRYSPRLPKGWPEVTSSTS